MAARIPQITSTEVNGGRSDQLSGAKTSALSNKITSILSASFSDREIRSALEILDEREIQNTATLRRHLRSDIQKEVIECNAEIIKDFGVVAEQLRLIGKTIKSLESNCEIMRQQVETARSETGPVMKEAVSLMRKREETNVQQKVLAAFNNHFVISDSQQLLLTSSSEPVNDQFFSELIRVQAIHKDCEALLGGEDQRLGLDIMEKSSKCLNGAFQKLYRWVQQEFKTLNLENPQISSSIRRALRTLAQRPTLFRSCLDSFAEFREHNLSDSFHGALTGSYSSGEGNTTKPIEFVAHDPLRYIGDMLAWTHATTVSEREALEALFVSEGDEMRKGIEAGLESDLWSRADEAQVTTFDGAKALNELVNRDLAGIARTLRQRIEQVVQGHEDAVLAYKISNLINFYLTTFRKMLGEDSSLLETLIAVEESALRQCKAIMRDSVAALQGELLQVPPNLREPEFLAEALQKLKMLLQDFDKSLRDPKTREENFEPILREALDPFIDGCQALAKSLGDFDLHVFELNCLFASVEVLAPYDFVDKKRLEYQKTIQEHSSKLSKYQHRWFLDESGLNPIMAALKSLGESRDDIQKIPTLEPFQEQNIILSSQKLDDFLPSALLDAMETLKPLRDQQYAQQITQEAAEKFCEDFEFVEGRILAADDLVELRDETDENEEPQKLRDLYPRTGAEIKVLLS